MKNSIKNKICRRRRTEKLLILVVLLLAIFAFGKLNQKESYGVERVKVHIPKEEKLVPELVPEQEECTQFISTYEESIRNEEFVLCTLIAEAANQAPYGQLLVLEVIWNRTQDSEFPNTEVEVCKDDGQFSCIQDGQPILGEKLVTPEQITPEMREMYFKVTSEMSKETERLLKEEAQKQGLTDEKYWKGGALYFSNLDKVTPEVYEANHYDRIQVSVKVGDHTFWRYWGE